MASQAEIVKAQMLAMPAHKPPPGVVPNFVDPPNHRALSYATLILCLIITTSMTAIRMWVKIVNVRRLHLEDWLLPLAYLFHIGHIVPAIMVTTFDPIYHQWDMPLRNFIQVLLDLHVAYLFYYATILVLKLCIMMQFLRIFVPAKKKSATYWITHVLIWVNSLFYFASIFVEIFSCKPMEKRWDPLIEGTCINVMIVHPISASLNVSLDALLLLWTQRVIWSLHMTRTRRWKIAVPFMAGCLACVFASLRVFTSIRLLYTTDIAYWGAFMGLSTFPEIASGFLVLSLPVLPHFYKNIRRRMGYKVQRQSMSVAIENKRRTSPRSWLHISQDSAPEVPVSQSGKRMAITRTDHVIIEFMSLGCSDTESILPARPDQVRFMSR